MEYFDVNDPLISSRIIFKNNLVFAFPTNIPIVPGHILVCPIRRVVAINELTQEELVAIFDLIDKLKSSMTKVFGAFGYNHAWNEGKKAGQSVQHLHIHILPRKDDDNGIVDYEPRAFLYRPSIDRPESPEEELAKVAQVIRNGL